MDTAPLPLSLFTRRVLVVMGIVLLTALFAYFLWSVGHGLLVIFAGILFAIFLDALARTVYHHTPIGRGGGLIIAVFLLIVLGLGGSWIGGARIAAQAPQLTRELSNSLDRISTRLQKSALVKQTMGGPHSDPNALSFGEKLVGNVSHVLSVTMSTVTDAVVILIIGIYFSISPGFYVESAVRLAPVRKQERAMQVMDAIGHALRRWFVGRLMAMLLVGAMTTAGLYIIGIKLALLLGIIAGILTFVPYLGAIVSAVPAILVALLGGSAPAIYVVALYLVVHLVEGYVFTPLVQKRIVHLAPGFLLMAQLLAGLFAGIFGILVATPLALTLTVGVQMLYMQDVLGESPHILGDEAAVYSDAGG